MGFLYKFRFWRDALPLLCIGDSSPCHLSCLGSSVAEHLSGQQSVECVVRVALFVVLYVHVQNVYIATCSYTCTCGLMTDWCATTESFRMCTLPFL